MTKRRWDGAIFIENLHLQPCQFAHNPARQPLLRRR
jgi:hypothetical protein